MTETKPLCQQAAEEYIERGWSVIPLRPKAKEPATRRGLNDWSDNPGQPEIWWGQNRNFNVGIVCGTPSHGLCVIDLDVHDGEDGLSTLRDWETANGKLPETVTVTTGSGGRHLLYNVGREIRPSANAALGVDIRCDGSYIVAPPSIHPNGEFYDWSISPDDIDVADADDNVYSFIEFVRPGGGSTGGGGVRDKFDLPDTIETDRNDTLFRYAASLRSTGRTADEIAILVTAANATRCKPPLPDAEVRKIVGSASKYEQGNAANPVELAAAAGGATAPKKPAERMRDETVEKIQNVLLADANICAGVKLNRFDGRLHVVADCIEGTEYREPHVITDGETAKLLTVLERDHGVRNKGKYLDALAAFGATRGQSYDPMAEFIDSLPQIRDNPEGFPEISRDGETWETFAPVVGQLFIKYLGADESFYVMEAERLVLRQVVARAMWPGCKADVMPILTGKQGIGKSTFVSALALDNDFFLEGFSNFNDEDLKRLSGKLVVEIPELDGFGSRDMNRIKSVITRQFDTYRESYARNPVSHPRTSVFFGTTNDSEFLTDQSGNRRFLPIECKRPTCDPHPGLFNGELTRDVQQAWAEIVHEARTKGRDAFLHSLVLPKEVAAEALEAQERYTQEDYITNEVQSYLDDLPRSIERVNVKMVCIDGLGWDEVRYSTAKPFDLTRIANALSRCRGWVKMSGRQRVEGYGTTRAWRRETLLDDEYPQQA